MASEANLFVYDEVTQLPSLHAALPRVRLLLDNFRRLGLIYVDLTHYGHFEEAEGGDKFDEIVRRVAKRFQKFASEISRESILAVDWPSGGDLVAFVAMDDPELDRAAMHEICQMLDIELTSEMHELLRGDGTGRYAAYVGYDVVHQNSLVRFERLIRRGINEALNMAMNEDARERNYRIGRLREIVRRRDLRPLFQPIQHLQKGLVVGYEVLIRGPENTKFNDPSVLFSTAQSCNMTFQLEEAGQSQMLDVLRANGSHQYFLNVEPDIIEKDELYRLPVVQDRGIDSRSLVIEVTERAAITNLEAFARSIQRVKETGLRVAVDDVGSGYASIESVAFLKPDYIKIDRLLIHEIHEDPTRREVTRTILDLASRIDAMCIAEGIEKAAEMECLIDLGVELGQGFYLGRPNPAPPAAPQR
ncbi:MAG: EAL domain-containing protein [Nitrospirae bacterium]|nr:EAL domain-containing protein [Nitrospirota bacterium]